MVEDDPAILDRVLEQENVEVFVCDMLVKAISAGSPFHAFTESTTLAKGGKRLFSLSWLSDEVKAGIWSDYADLE